MVYYGGYFSWVVGFLIPPIDIQDLSLSSVVLAGGLLTAYNLWMQFNAGEAFSGYGRYLIYFVAIVTALYPSVSGLVAAGWNTHGLIFWSNLTWFFLVALVVVTIVFWQFAKKKITEIDLREISGFLIVATLFLWLFGFHSFLSDLKSSKVAKVESSRGTLEVLVLRIMSANIVGVNKDDCNFVLINRSDVSSIKFETATQINFSNIRQLDCLFK